MMCPALLRFAYRSFELEQPSVAQLALGRRILRAPERQNNILVPSVKVLQRIAKPMLPVGNFFAAD